MNLANCPQCGKVYVKNSYNICPSCLKELEEQYRKCADYLRKNRGCTLKELSEGTGVSVNLIIRFIREGRIAAKDAPNVLVPCESCGEPVKEGPLCANCRSKLSKDVHNMREDEKRRAEYKSSSGGSTYMKNRDKFEKS
ncbi:TIGR03826 family flagellar region protein [Paenibacillus flagellatus]|uniref:Flagellar protein n=1 Tax=Paenibacillus flagellatus TaxID=2211139 RepID=A0A2V5K104_9BACL|nr:TIGR03826 family flagellar region protein [Paenibacillus flagellatus]PYI51173.1 flagellar protein [Paenibacillus flagellatus]